jgi:hypothetical protein
MDFKEDVNCNNGLLENFVDYIRNEILNGLKDHPDLDKFIADNHIPLYLKTFSVAGLIDDDLSFHKGHITKDFTKRLLRDWRDKEENSNASVLTEWEYKDGKVYIVRFTVRITTAALAKDICDNIFDLNMFKKKLRWMLKHEVGHMVDYMRNRHNIPVEELNRLLTQDREDYAKYYDELAQVKEWTYEMMRNDNRKYYSMHQEAAANIAAEIDVEDLIAIDEEIRSKYHNKQVTIQISQSDIHDILPKEETNNG